MAEESSDDKTEAPSDKKRGEARQNGTVVKSTEINSVLILFGGLVVLRIFSPMLYREACGVFRYTIGLLHDPVLGEASIELLIRYMVVKTIMITLPIIGIIMIIGVITNLLQVGFLFTLKPLMPSFSKINPISGFARMFSGNSLVELVKNILKLVIVASVAYLSIKAEFSKFLTLYDTSVAVIWVFLLKTAYAIIFRVCLVLLIIAILDFMYQKFQHEKKLKMTKQEVKDERKQMEGDPQVKSRIKSLQREMARRRMMDEVPKATVVVTNPTHIAIAMRYESSVMKTPVVVAKGKRLVAQRIKEIAIENGIPIVEDKPLARAMYDKVEVGMEIPVDFFTAIAEILAYVYRLKHRAAA